MGANSKGEGGNIPIEVADTTWRSQLQDPIDVKTENSIIR